MLLTALGLFCIFRTEWFLVTFPLLTVLYGIATLLAGIHKIQWPVDMLRMEQKYWYIVFICVAATLVFAVLILVNPFATSAVLWNFIAAVLIG